VEARAVEAEPVKSETNLVLAAISRLEQQQRQQQEALNHLLAVSAETKLGAVRIPDVDDADFDTAFQRFLNAYARLPAEARPHKIRRVVLASSSSSSQQLSEFIDLCTGTSPRPAGSGCACLNCPHKKELDSWGEICSHFVESESFP
jgi:hypothetical protein